MALALASGLLVAPLLWLWAVQLPGYVVGRTLVPEVRGVERIVVSLLCAFAVVPLGIFLAAVAASAPVDPALVLLFATAINLGGLAVFGPRQLALDLQIDKRQLVALAAAAMGCGLFTVFALRSLDGGDVLATLQHCLYVIVAHTVGNDPSIALPFYDGLSDGPLYVLVHHGTSELNGLGPLFVEQRLGNAAILAPAVSLFGTAGWFLTTVHAAVLCAYGTWLVARELGAAPWAAKAGAALLVWAGLGFLGYQVNENLFVAAVVATLSWAALRNESSGGLAVLVGLTCGLMLGLRHTAVLFWPGVLVAFATRPLAARERWTQLGLGAGAALLTAGPWLYVNALMMGTPLAHPKLRDVEARIVTNEIFGWAFSFKPLNWPFTNNVVRGPWSPLPSFLWIPLWVAKCFGQIPIALAGLGKLKAAMTERRKLSLLLLLAAPHAIAIAWVENLDWEQITYVASSLPAVAALVAVGLNAAARWPLPRRELGFAAACLVAVTLASFALRVPTFQVDPRLLNPAHWPKLPAEDRGVVETREALTELQLLPRTPVLRSDFAGLMARSLGALLEGGPETGKSGLPRYPSGNLSILAGYAQPDPVTYAFEIAGRAVPEPNAPQRTADGLSHVSLALPAESVRVTMSRQAGRYAIDVVPEGPSATPRDFSFYLTPWNPPIDAIRVTLNGRPLTGLRQLEHGPEDRPYRVVTNHPPEQLDLVTIPFEVDIDDEASPCGVFIFVGTGHERIETLVLAGGHTLPWNGESRGELRIPRNLMAERLVLMAEPYCSDHVPQYGDRYGVAEGPFTADRRLSLRLDRRWRLQ